MKGLSSFLIALQFLTQIPVFFKQYPDEKIIARSLVFYPMIGLLIGGILSLFTLLFSGIPHMLSAALILAIWLGLTGGLHMDGLADSADGWLGGQGDKARTLAIMKDPCSGPIAVIIIFCLLLIKWSALVALLDLQAAPASSTVPDYSLYLALILAPLIARTQLPLLLLNTPYVRRGGIGEKLVQGAPKKQVYLSATFFLLFALYLNTFFLLMAVALAVFVMRKMMIQRLDGLTGDTAGASVEVIEALVLVVLVAQYY